MTCIKKTPSSASISSCIEEARVNRIYQIDHLDMMSSFDVSLQINIFILKSIYARQKRERNAVIIKINDEV